MHTNIWLTSSVVFALLIYGCNGEIRTKRWNQNDLQGELAKEDGIRGVIGYYTKSVIELSKFTQFVGADGKIVGECNGVKVQKIVTVTDYEHPYQVYYKYGWLEGNTFGVQMSNSNNVFTGFNSVSVPDQGKTIEALAHAFSMAKPSPTFAPGPEKKEGTPYCNSGPSFEKYEALPKLP